MSDSLCITIRWLDARYHGRIADGSEPEWPPSPLRLFQALIAGAKRGHWTQSLAQAFQWLEGSSQRTPPIIVAPDAPSGQPYTLFVPNNDTDKPADAQRAAKVVRPTILPDDTAVHYLWSLSPDEHGYAERIARCARHLIALGWGIDLAIGDGRIIDETEVRLTGIRFKPQPAHLQAGIPLRVPIPGTLARLENVYESFLNRLADGVSRPPLPFNTYETISYTRADAPAPRAFIVFKLERGDESIEVEHTSTKYREPPYNQAQLIHVAAWVRHAAITLTKTRPKLSDLTEFVSGHGDRTKSEYRQLSYLPLPSIGHVHTDPSIRRIMIAEPSGSSGEALRRLAPYLHGVRLKPESIHTHAARLVRDDTGGVVSLYTKISRSWATVTPIILPGYDDHKPTKTIKLIQKALLQSGIDQPCEFEWSALPNFKNCLSAHKYDRNRRWIGYHRPDHLKDLTAVHLRLRFERSLSGPVVVGAGRHCGLGVFAATV
jgi:CRISPR-associated protein Csb2